MGRRRPAAVPQGQGRNARRKVRDTRAGGRDLLPPALASLTHAHPLLVSGEPLEPDGACAVGRRDPAVPHFPADAGQPPGRLHRSELHRGGAAGTPAPVWPGPALHVQYAVFLSNLVRGEFGRSFFSREPVSQVMWQVLPNTLVLTLSALLLAYAVGVVGGALLAARRGTWAEAWGIPAVLATRAAPEFWVGMLALALFSFTLNWFPSSGATSPGSAYSTWWAQVASWDFLRHLTLPALTLALYLQGLPTLLMRSTMLEVMDEDFITFCRMRGLPERTILLRHAARNALLPVVTAFALGIGYSIGGNVIIETVFSWPGLGRTLVRAV